MSERIRQQSLAGGSTTRQGGGSAGRVIAGVARGRRLAAPGPGTRPLGDRVKQSLFAILEPGLRDAAFLDLFAGSGAAGIEALSRGARVAVFVERKAAVSQVIERNLRTAGLLDPRARIVVADVLRWLRDAATAAGLGPFDAVVLDPPYDEPQLAARSLDAIAAAGPGVVLGAEGVAVAKHARRTGPAPGYGLLRSIREERFGETVLTFYRWSDADEGEEVG
ncbi:MAG TPA: 16S rRNA (guanine(966)-N(2))-methyltransferase RsmD [Candidatus Limnocylindrales bacterium]|nr:16S rRNA (guanine(966)-N(2))-methyltransferase RsmD [Candidatus Limnocylindrales bacterium]